MKSDNVKSALLLGAAGVALYLGWKAYSSGKKSFNDAAAAVGQFVDQQVANVQSAVANNITGPYAAGRLWAETGESSYKGEKAWLYSDYAYTGIDAATGLLVTDGEWYGNADARRYDAAQIAAGAAPAATSVGGAAFGVYPSAFGSWAISAAAANDARRVFAAKDPRRVDL